MLSSVCLAANQLVSRWVRQWGTLSAWRELGPSVFFLCVQVSTVIILAKLLLISISISISDLSLGYWTMQEPQSGVSERLITLICQNRYILAT